MKFLKDEIQSKIFPKEYNNGNLTEYQCGHNIAYSVVISFIQLLIEKEKEQICNAYMDGHYIKEEFYNPEEYYNETYQNK